MKRINLGREWQLVALMGAVALGVSASGMTGCSDDASADPSDDAGSGSSGQHASSSSGEGGSSSSGRAGSSGTTSGGSSGSSSQAAITASPRLARAGALLTLTGTGFHASQGTSAVTVGGVDATVVAWSDTSIQVRAPQTAAGVTDFVVTIDGVASTVQIRVLARSEALTASAPVGPYAAAVNQAGSVVAWGCGNLYPKMCNPNPVIGTQAGLVTRIATGNLHIYAVHEGGLTGWTYDGAALASPPGMTGLRAISAGIAVTYVIFDADGGAKSWHNADVAADAGVKGPALAFGGATGLVDVRAGWYYALALTEDGTVLSQREDVLDAQPGNYDCHQADVPANLTDVVAIAAGTSFALALKADGTVVSWGGTGCATATVPAALVIPTDLTHVVGIAAGFGHVLALHDDGTVVGWGDDQSQQTTGPAALDHVLMISAGSGSSVVVTEDGVAHGWGQGAFPVNEVPAGLLVKLP